MLKSLRFTSLMTLFLGVALLTGGCASVSSKFNKTKKVNLTPFATQTINMVGNMDYNMSGHEMIYLRQIKDYIDEDAPFEYYFILENQVKSMIKRMMVYSIQLVSVSEQKISEQAKVNALADMIVVLAKDVKNAGNVPMPLKQEGFDTAIQKIRVSTTYLQGLENAQSLVNAFSEWSGRVLDALREEKILVGRKVSEAVSTKYMSSIAFAKQLRIVRNQFADDLVLLAKYTESNDPKYLVKLRSSQRIPVRLALKGGKKSLSIKEIVILHGAMTKRMRMLNENFDIFSKDIENYHRSLLELDHLLANKEAAIKSARLVFIAWNRAHGKMAAGKLAAAEWFDISESGSLLFGAARRAVIP